MNDLQRPDVSGALDGLQGIGDRQAVEYERACQLLMDLLGVCAANRAKATTEQETALFTALQQRWLRERRALAPSDRLAVQRVLTEYPALLQDLTGEIA